MFSFRSPLRLTVRCVLYYNTSWQGDPLRVPVASPRPLVLQGIGPHRTSETYRPKGATRITRIVWPMHHQSGERSCYPRHLHDQGDFAPPWTPRSEGRSWLSPLNTPSTNPTRIGYAPSFPPMDHDQHFGYWTSSRVFAPCTTTKERPWMRYCQESASPHPGLCPDPTQPSYPSVCFIYDGLLRFC